jgi:hypothetical protein
MAGAANSNFSRANDVAESIRTCQQILREDLFAQGFPVFGLQLRSRTMGRAAVTLLLIHLRDLLVALDNAGHRVAFDDDIHPDGKAKDVTDLIVNARNAACHVTSGNHFLEDGNKFTYNVIVGRVPRAFVINDVALGSDYPDDVAIFFGINRIYLNRHLTRALNEGTQVAVEHLEGVARLVN